uniref:RGS domain-containing protein n=1 Tax=Athene cunicularia TaxID=194338 RepID=A0A663N383_ATHCN
LPSSILTRCFPLDLGGSFTEDAPRPPVPGEEGELVSTDPRPVSHGFYSGKSDVVRNETSTATPRRSDLDLGYEPEGSASPTPPYLKWAESLHSLLDDQDGINLFRTFLKQEDCADLLDFWFACSGFRKLEPCIPGAESWRCQSQNDRIQFKPFPAAAFPFIKVIAVFLNWRNCTVLQPVFFLGPPPTSSQHGF